MPFFPSPTTGRGTTFRLNGLGPILLPVIALFGDTYSKDYTVDVGPSLQANSFMPEEQLEYISIQFLASNFVDNSGNPVTLVSAERIEKAKFILHFSDVVGNSVNGTLAVSCLF